MWNWIEASGFQIAKFTANFQYKNDFTFYANHNWIWCVKLKSLLISKQTLNFSLFAFALLFATYSLISINLGQGGYT